MGKKGNWLSSLKRVFTATPKDKQFNVADKKVVKEKKKWETGKWKNGETTSFFPLLRKPSSIEKILGDAERENKNLQVLPPKKVHHPKPSIPSAPTRFTRHPTQVSVTKIQAAYRGYTARKNYRVLKSLIKLQVVMEGQRVKRQTVNTLRCMQLLVKVQSQIHSRRIQMMERKSLRHRKPQMSEIDMESTFSKWSFTHQSEAERRDDWDDSMLAKDEIDARTKRKVDAVLKRERALAYAHSRQLKSDAMAETKSGGVLPMWWNWVGNHVQGHHQHKPQFTTTAPTSIDNNVDYVSKAPTPKSAKQQTQTRTSRYRDVDPRDDDSLTSCPAIFAATPRYMAPTVSAGAKVTARHPVSPRVGCPAKKRFSFGMGESVGSMRWRTEKRTPMTAVGKHRPTHSVGSVDSTVSLPVGFGRNRNAYQSTCH